MANDVTDAGETPQSRLRWFLARQAELGISQQAIAERTGMPAQYISDVKNGRRSLTELFARRLEQEFGVDRLWLLCEAGSSASLSDSEPWPVVRPEKIFLPVLPWPIEGDPRLSPHWDGSSLEICGAAPAQIAKAAAPYILRFGAKDRHGRIHQNDLVLVSQTVPSHATIYVVKTTLGLSLARRKSKSGWEAVAKGKTLPDTAVPVGHCLGIVWGVL